MDWKQVLEIASPVTIIFAAGMLYQEIRTFRSEIRDLRDIREEWSAIKVRLGSVESALAKNVSDVRGLREKLGETRERLASVHDLEE